MTVVLLFTGLFAQAQAQDFHPLWPEGEIPNIAGDVREDSIANERIYRVKTPGITAYFPSKEENTGAAVVICPPGGYHHLTYVIAGTQLARWFNVMGMNAFVLRYRLPNQPELQERSIAPLQDAQRAVRLIRANADRWHIDPERVGVMGASSGGHLASTLGTHSNDVAAIGDSLDSYTYRPNFMIMVSPVISMGKYTHEGSRDNLLGKNPSPELVKRFSNELQVTEATPPAFLVHAANDGSVDPMNSILFYEALLKHNAKSALHIFPQGGHSIALRNNPGSTNLWTDLCEAWLREIGVIGN
ncbi:MAG: alpha/beta hydrolase [Candidatus Marinimicrobia bacterium]|nr:alpha/beta hydrolase [Candidatus Neomarinimicrobiota bacterium]MCF7827412.1 alpha/beta hydrolase [Candidatus Neomarinimicrobiota bacterium]MCF7881355.1 alpha/beta hydrolase [Candidatus Neomarinimicrobiota bacterium]